MAVKIKLMRMGKIRAPYYRIVVADSRTKRDGRAIETLGKYHPTEEPSLIELDSARVQHWLGVGAQPTEPVQAILRVTGDWQRFRGEAGAEGSLRTAAPRADKRAVFEAAARESGGEPSLGATTPRKRAAGRGEAPAAESADAVAGAAQPATAAPTDVRSPEATADPQRVEAAQAPTADADAPRPSEQGGSDEPGRASDQPATPTGG